MTEYGRGPGSDPWHPQDPLYGDPGWNQHPAEHPEQGGSWGGYGDEHGGPYPHQSYATGHPGQQGPAPQHPTGSYQESGGWETGAGQQSYYPQQPYQHGQDGYGQSYDTGGYPAAGYQTGGHQEGYQSGGYDTGGYPAGDYGQGGYGQGVYDQSGYGQSGYDQSGYDQSGGYPSGGYHQGGYDTGEQPSHPGGDYPAEQGGYPPARPARGAADGGRGRRPGPDADPDTGWDPGPDQGESDFFNRQDDDDWDDEDTGDSDGRGGRGGKPKRRRGGCACLGIVVLLVGVLGVAGYYGKQFYDDRFGPAEDYSGEGLDEEVQVEIPEGATLAQMGGILRDAGVVASVGAFTEAAEGTSIQPGFYTLRLEMSADSVVSYMTDPDTLNTLVLPEGLRAAQIYEAIDSKLGLEEGSAAAAAESGTVELPDWAVSDDEDIKDPLEGFLFPARYDIGDETDPETLLQSMVDRASARYEELGVNEEAAAEAGLDSARDIITVASLVQAEGITSDDFRQMAEVVYNRLEPDNDVTNRKVEFDSTYNYLMGQSELVITEQEIHSNDDPYNTYYHPLLPPGPIGNPGDSAVEAALDPTDDGWMFFISLDSETTTFTETHEEHEELRKEYNERHGITGTN